ncbi:Retrovirus-related Pol polyprotein from transposon 17.6, partial [Dictyocoela muelleri]
MNIPGCLSDRNGPFVFQRAISNILRDCNNCKIFIDDILIYAKDIDSHVHNLKIIMQKLFENNVVINFDKSEFIKAEITFLGQIISSDGIKPEISRIKGFEFKEPKTKKHLMKIIGLVQWYRKYVPKLSHKLRYFFAKLKKDYKFQWNTSDTTNLNKIINEIKIQTLLSHPDINK